ncbi:MAG TPA: NADH-quinone oxidoreductase subunit M [Acidimicrobiia bacterium]|nr:NADH-quinone oxidoreductase subunit M [Acidimicrobiia bacterium]
MDFPILTAIILMPLAGAIAVLCTPAHRPELARAFAYAASAATLGLAGWLLWSFQTGTGGFQFVQENRWFDELGTGYIVGVDGFSIFMVAITALLFPIGLLAGQRMDHRVKAYTVFFLLLESAIMGIFLSLDLIAFFVFWEFMLVPMYFLIAGWGSSRRQYAAMKFFLYTAAGSAFLLAGILILGFLHQADTGLLTFDYRVLAEWNGLASSTEKWLFLAFMAAFAVKAPLFPFHTWLPDVHTEAPTAGSVVLAGVILKMGAYGFLRFSFELFPQASVDFAPVIITLATIGIVYGAIVAAMQKDAKRVIAYSSVSHMGFILLGIFSLTTFGLDGAAFTMVSHPLTTGALFLVIGMLYERRHTRMIDDYRGIWRVAPILSAFFLAALFAGIGLPGFSGFIGEFLSLLGAFITYRWWAVVATTGVILAALYMLWLFQRMFTGLPDEKTALMGDLNVREIVVVAPLVLLSLFIGVYPRPVLDRVEPTVKRVLANFEAKTDYREPDAPEPARLESRESGRGEETGR